MTYSTFQTTKFQFSKGSACKEKRKRPPRIEQPEFSSPQKMANREPPTGCKLSGC